MSTEAPQATDHQALFEHIHKSFEAALVSCMDYFRLVWDDKDREIAALKKRIEECEATITHLKTTRAGGQQIEQKGTD